MNNNDNNNNNSNSHNGNDNNDNNSSNNNNNNNNNSSNNNSSNNNSNNNNNDRTEIVCVVSEELYDNIRERLLPYHGNLLHFVSNIIGISIFAYITFTLVRILQASDVSPTVQLLTTFGVSTFPYIMNTIDAKKSEEQKDTWKEQLKHRVKPLVDKFTANNPELSRTQLII
jgi:hypothetical protein